LGPGTWVERSRLAGQDLGDGGVGGDGIARVDGDALELPVHRRGNDIQLLDPGSALRVRGGDEAPSLDDGRGDLDRRRSHRPGQARRREDDDSCPEVSLSMLGPDHVHSLALRTPTRSSRSRPRRTTRAEAAAAITNTTTAKAYVGRVTTTVKCMR